MFFLILLLFRCCVSGRLSPNPPNCDSPPGSIRRHGNSGACESGTVTESSTSTTQMGNMGSYTTCFRSVAEFACFPRARRPAHAVAMGAQARNDARIVSQTQEFAEDSQWQRADRAGSIGVVCMETFHQMGTREYSPYAQYQMSREWFGLRRVVYKRQMEDNQKKWGP